MTKKKPSEEVLRDFVDNAASYEIGETKLIAENPDFGVEIYLGGEVKYGSGLFPTITVFVDNDVVFDETAYTTMEFRDMLEDIYKIYLTSNFIDGAAEMEKVVKEEEDDDPIPSEQDEEEEIGEQESLLDEQVLAFLAVAYGYDPLEKQENGDDILEKLKDAFCMACAEHVGDGIYRPVYIEDKNGKWVFERYPYESTAGAE